MKDYTLLKNKLTKESQITTKDIIALGFSQYDIKLFLENNILTKVSRGLYYYRPSLVEEPEKEEITNQPPVEVTESIPQEEISGMLNKATNYMIKKEQDQAIALFEEILKIDPTNQYARFSIFACFMYKKDFETAYNKLIEVYINRTNNELLLNTYNYMLLLKELVEIDEKMLNDIANIIATDGSNIKRPKPGSNLYKLTRAIRECDWENAIKYANFIISVDKNQKKYRLTNQCYKFLVIAVIKSKNLVFERPISVPDPKIEYDEEPTIIVPPTNVEQTIKQNLLLEAINQNNYQQALTILEQEKVENPELIIKSLLIKLHSIQSLITTTIPVKVTTSEEVRIVEERHLVEKEVTNEPQIVEPKSQESTVSKPVPEEKLTDIAYKAYKEFLNNQNFDKARRNLQRYEYLSNQEGTHRNINYHYKRVEMLEKEYTSNPDRYFEKLKLQERIFQSRKRKNYEEVLSLIEEYKKLGGLIHPTIPVIEAEIHIMLNNLQKAEQIISSLEDNEEPAYYTCKARILYEQRKYEECIHMCIAYNERRPSSSAANYIMLSNCYKRLQKPSKALKALRKADEINKSRNFIKDLTSEIEALENQTEYKKEQRLALTPKKK